MSEDRFDRLLAAADAGDLTAMDEIARLVDEGGAQHWLQTAARAGDPGAMARLGTLQGGCRRLSSDEQGQRTGCRRAGRWIRAEVKDAKGETRRRPVLRAEEV